MKTASAENIETIDTLIKQGKFESARKSALGLDKKRVAKHLVAELARTFNRVGLFQETLRILTPSIHPKIKPMEQASESVKAEYALALSQIGAYNESLRMFEKINPEKYKRTYLYHSISLFNQWRYVEAVPLLEKYLSNGLTPYEAQVAKVNLAAAYLAVDKIDESFRLLDEIKDFPADYGLNIRAQGFVQKSDYRSAKTCIERAQQKFSDSTKYSLIIEKWRVIINLALDKNTNRALTSMRSLRLRSVKVGHWQTVRECDFYRALITRDENLFFRVYFGSPYDSYRQNLIARFPGKVNIPTHYTWIPSEMPLSRGNSVFDIEKGIDCSSGSTIPLDSLIHKTIKALASDFYLPFRTETLFDLIYPNEYYDIDSSHTRVHSAVARLRKWLQQSNSLISLKLQPLGTRLFVKAKYGIVIPHQLQIDSGINSLVEDLKQLGGHSGFTTADLMNKLILPRRTALRRVTEMLEANLICSKGNGRSKRYFVK